MAILLSSCEASAEVCIVCVCSKSGFCLLPSDEIPIRAVVSGLHVYIHVHVHVHVMQNPSAVYACTCTCTELVHVWLHMHYSHANVMQCFIGTRA